MVFLWFSYGFPMVYRRISMISQYVSHSSPWSQRTWRGRRPAKSCAASAAPWGKMTEGHREKYGDIAAKYTGKSGDFLGKMGKYMGKWELNMQDFMWFLISPWYLWEIYGVDAKLGHERTTYDFSNDAIEIDPAKIGSATILPFWCGYYYRKKKTGIHQQPPKVLGKWNQEKLIHDFEAAIPLSEWCLYNLMTSRESVIIKSYHNTLGLSWNFPKWKCRNCWDFGGCWCKAAVAEALQIYAPWNELTPLASNIHADIFICSP